MEITWKEFADSDPRLAEIGTGLLFQFGVGLAFLATIRKDGGPRLHPFCPVMSGRADGRWRGQRSPSPTPVIEGIAVPS